MAATDDSRRDSTPLPAAAPQSPASQQSDGTLLARALDTNMAIFWGGRLLLQAVFDVKPHLTHWWLVVGYHGLTVIFLFFVGVFGWAALFV